MSMCHPLLHQEDVRTDRVQAHSMRKTLDSPVGFAVPHFDPSAVGPPPCQVRINQYCLVNEGSAIIELSDDIGERISGQTEYGPVVLTQLHSPSSQPSSFANFLLSVDDPPKPLALAKAVCRCCICHREVRVELNSFVITTQSFLVTLPALPIQISHSAQKHVVGIEACGWFAPGTVDFGL